MDGRSFSRPLHDPEEGPLLAPSILHSIHELDPRPCKSGIIGKQEDPNIFLIIPCSRYYWVGRPPELYIPKIPMAAVGY